MTQPIKQPDFKELFTTFGKIGLLSFGGPAAQIAMLQRIIVDEKKWMDQERLIHALNFCMLLPGPEAMQLATYAGWAVKGWRGGLLAGLLFVLPGAVVMLALSALYVAFGHVDVVAGLLFGLKAAVLAVVFEALYRMAKRTLASGFSLRGDRGIYRHSAFEIAVSACRSAGGCCGWPATRGSGEWRDNRSR